MDDDKKNEKQLVASYCKLPWHSRWLHRNQVWHLNLKQGLQRYLESCTIFERILQIFFLAKYSFFPILQDHHIAMYLVLYFILTVLEILRTYHWRIFSHQTVVTTHLLSKWWSSRELLVLNLSKNDFPSFPFFTTEIHHHKPQSPIRVFVKPYLPAHLLQDSCYRLSHLIEPIANWGQVWS